MANIDVKKLYELAGPNVEGLAGELYDFDAFLREHHEIKNALVDYSLEKTLRLEILNKLYQNSSPLFKELIDNLSLEEELLHEFSWLTRNFINLVEEQGNIKFAELKSALPLSDKDLALIKSRFGTNVKYKVVVDPSLLGGIVLSFSDGRVLDLSLKGQLEQLRGEIVK